MRELLRWTTRLKEDDMKKKFRAAVDWLKENIVIIITFVLIILYLCRGAMVEDVVAIKALEEQGFQKVEINEKAWFLIELRGGGHDCVRFKAAAINSLNRPVEVLVFAGWPFKGATIRSLKPEKNYYNE